jgi:hypothetical protein
MIKSGVLDSIFIKTSISKTLKVLREQMHLIQEVNIYSMDKSDETKYVIAVSSDTEEVKFVIDFNDKNIYMM